MRHRAFAIGSLVATILAIGWMTLQPAPKPQDRALSSALPDGPLTIVTFGTSLTAPPQIWPDRLAEALAACRDTRVGVERVAGPGRGSVWALGQVAKVVAHDPDLVLVELAINDADFRDGASLARGRAQHRGLITGLRGALPKAQIVLMTMNPATGLRGWIRPRLAVHYRQYRDLAAEAETGLIDLYPRWLALPRGERGLSADGLHPDPERAAEIIVPQIVRYLEPFRKCP
ncbi:MAG: SGNH/GDSL hydrolase family protein [Pseudorhodobacter sp.]